MPELNYDGEDAVKVTIFFLGGVMDIRFARTKGRCLPSLPTTLNARPLIGFDLVDAGGEAIYRRHFTPPGNVEIPGIRPHWSRLPKKQTQVLVALVPRLVDAKRIQLYAGLDTWMSHAFPGGL